MLQGGGARRDEPDARLKTVRRATLLSLLATLPFWGAILLPWYTYSPTASVPNLRPDCRTGAPDLACEADYRGAPHTDPGATAIVEAPSSYLNARGFHVWNPYIGSGIPEIFDGHNGRYSPSALWTRLWPGEQGRDLLIFFRVFMWTLGIVLLVALLGGSIVAQACAALAAALAPHLTGLIDHPVLEVGLLAPWFLVLLLAAETKRLSFAAAAVLCLALGVLAGLLSFLQSQLVLCFAIGLEAVCAALATRSRSVALGLVVALGFLLTWFAWSPVIFRLDEFWSTRQVFTCVAGAAQGLVGYWQRLTGPTFASAQPDSIGTLAAIALAVSVIPQLKRRELGYGWAALTLVITFGLPKLVCAIPGISAVDFSRHLAPHVQALLIALAALAIDRFAFEEKPGLRIVALVAAVAVVRVVFGAGFVEAWVDVAFALVFIVAATGLAEKPAARWWRTFGLAGIAFVSMALNNRMFSLALRKEVRAITLPLTPGTPMAEVQRVSQSEDRRHFSNDDILFPNWSGALRILDMRYLGSFNPKHLYALNGYAAALWAIDPSQGGQPDRFVGTAPKQAMLDVRFLRLLALHRVSLFTFFERVQLTADGGPYSRDRCPTLAEAPPLIAVRCSDVPGVGSFPRTLAAVKDDSEAFAWIDAHTPQELAEAALLATSPTLQALGPGRGSVVAFARGLDSLRYELQVDAPGYFYIADTFFSGWRAEVNGMSAPIERANVAFKAVHVPEGRVVLDLKLTY
ncbi:MAG: hypothetical protein IT381_11880 [Deltaproteobacteria bacterium]|nr:hypothetical protein [Deltaproteobacteria bacterium]